MVQHTAPPVSPPNAFDPYQITRPDPVLFKYYFIMALLTGPLFPITFVPLLFKYETLRYRFDRSGISMSWGLLFRRETYLTYRRIQDIHLTRNLLQRWMGLATVSVQTASGSATPEMSIEGVLAAEQLRDFLYSQMRGVKGDSAAAAATGVADSAATPVENGDEALTLLREIRDELRRWSAAGGPP